MTRDEIIEALTAQGGGDPNYVRPQVERHVAQMEERGAKVYRERMHKSSPDGDGFEMWETRIKYDGEGSWEILGSEKLSSA